MAHPTTDDAVEPAATTRPRPASAPVFVGRETTTVDRKGRVAIPASFREVVARYDAARVALLAELDGYVRLMPAAEWTDELGRIDAFLREADHDLPAEEVERLRFHYFGGTVLIGYDNLGRFVLIADELVWSSGGDHVQLWSPERLRARFGSSPADMRGSVERLGRSMRQLGAARRDGGVRG